MVQEPLSTWDEDLPALDLGAFPRAQDFVVAVTTVVAGDGDDRQSWMDLSYVVPSWNLEVIFPWWDKSIEEMRGWTAADAPCGSVTSPYWGRDQGWSLILWQSGDEVFIMAGDGSEGYDDPPVYQRWFAVPAGLYRSAWETAIEGFRTKSQ
jgi:hypothetical protein